MQDFRQGDRHMYQASHSTVNRETEKKSERVSDTEDDDRKVLSR
jgi:hypothetical protein